jgi:glutamate racemase
MIVVACNTASSVALEMLENELPVPVLGVVKPGAMSALKATRNGIIGIIGTSATVASGSYQRELVRINPNIKSVSAACPLFVSLAEEGWVSGPVVKMVAEKYLDEFQKSGIDTLILGCTHYPLLRAVINEILGDKVVLVDSAEAAVRGVFELLERENGFKRDGKKPHHKFYVSDSPDRFRKVGERFLSEPIDEVLKVALEDVSSF